MRLVAVNKTSPTISLTSTIWFFLIRQTIKELGGTMPEDLPTPGKSIQQLEREQKKLNP